MACRWHSTEMAARALVGLALIAATSCSRSSAVYHEGRLLVLDQLHSDGSHQSRYLLYASSPEQQVLALAPNQMLKGYSSHDVVKVLLQPPTPSKRSIRSLLTETAEAPSTSVGSEYAVVGIRLLETAQDTAQVPSQSDAQPLPGTSQMLLAQRTTCKSSTDNNSRLLQATAPLPPVYARTPKVVSDMPAIYYIMDFDGLGGGPATTAQNFMATVTANVLPSYMSACSHGIASMTPSNTRVVNVTMPRNGTLSTGQAWAANNCDGGNLVNLARAVDEYAQNTLGIDHTQYRHHALILPGKLNIWMGSTCGWVGTAVVGLATPAYSYAWISGDVWDKPQIYMHEFSHNYNLGHSNRLAGTPTVSNPSQEPLTNLGSHADWSSAMGYCCSTRCLHAAHSWQMGWSQAVATLTGYDINLGSNVTLFIPSHLSSRRSFVTVTTDWMVSGLAATSVAANPASTESGEPAATYASEGPAAEAGPSTPMGGMVSPQGEGETKSAELEHLYEAPTGARNSESPNWGISTKMAADVSSAAPAVNSMNATSTGGAAFPSQHTFWVSWRPRTLPYDEPGYGYQDGLLIHLYDGTSQSDSKDTFFQTLITDAGQAWTDTYYGSGLRVQLVSANYTGAIVTISRISVPAPTQVASTFQGQGTNGGTDESLASLSPSPPPASPFPSPSPPPATQPSSPRPKRSPAPPKPPRKHRQPKKRS